jgi:hypothetical protein
MEELKVLILLFKILVGTQNSSFKIYSQFGHAPSECFTSPCVGYWYILFACALQKIDWGKCCADFDGAEYQESKKRIICIAVETYIRL